MQEKRPLVASRTPATQACALTRKGIGDLLVFGTTPNPLSHTSQSEREILEEFGLVCVSSRGICHVSQISTEACLPLWVARKRDPFPGVSRSRALSLTDSRRGKGGSGS